MIIKSGKTEYLFIVFFLIFTFLIINKMIKEKQYQDSLEYFIGEGASMEPTILDGEEIVADPNINPDIDDVIVFKCQGCKIEKEDIDILTKRVINISSEGCFWVEGDNKARSYDSRNFGWLCDKDIELYGVVEGK